MKNNTTFYNNIKNYKTRKDLYYEIDQLENIIDYIVLSLKLYNIKNESNQIDFKNLYNQIIKYQVKYDFYPPKYNDLVLLSWSGDETTKYTTSGEFCSRFNHVSGHLATPNYDMSCYSDSYGFHKEKSARRIVKEEKIITKKSLYKKIEERKYFLKEFIKIIDSYLNYTNGIELLIDLKKHIDNLLTEYIDENISIEEINDNPRLIMKK